MRRRLVLWRRRWCLWRGHPMADWSPIVTYVPARYRMVGDSLVETSPEFTRRQWRCAFHDRQTR